VTGMLQPAGHSSVLYSLVVLYVELNASEGSRNVISYRQQRSQGQGKGPSAVMNMGVSHDWRTGG
jgi:hypothetical protein